MKKTKKFTIKFNAIKLKVFEFIKFDYHAIKFPFSLVLLIKYFTEKHTKQELKAIRTLSLLYRTGWAMSKKPVISEVNKLFSSSKSNIIFKKNFYQKIIDATQPLNNTEKFFADPKNLFEGNLIVLKSPTHTEKGVIIIKYSYYFPLVFKLFDTAKLAEKYHLVLEPSWAGLCDPGILLYTSLKTPVFVMAYEQRDWDFIHGINTNLIPVKISSNWWVDYRSFQGANNYQRDIDVIVVASWANFKRHFDIFRAIKKLKDKGHILNITLVGYPADMSIHDIKDIIGYWKLTEQVTLYEWIPPQEVASLMARSKVNLLWSRMEGVNRAIIEGMFCDTPVILREGFNYGYKYPYINNQTGEWANENTLENTILKIIDNFTNYEPRDYVMKQHTCETAIEILNECIAASCAKLSTPWTGNIELKVNELHGMRYFEKYCSELFSDDYDHISTLILNKE